MANSTLRLIQFNIIVLLALILTELEETFPKEYISDFLVCTRSWAQPYIMKMAIFPDHLAQRALVCGTRDYKMRDTIISSFTHSKSYLKSFRFEFEREFESIIGSWIRFQNSISEFDFMIKRHVINLANLTWNFSIFKLDSRTSGGWMTEGEVKENT